MYYMHLCIIIDNAHQNLSSSEFHVEDVIDISLLLV